jgi:hypothetical protein
VLEGEVNHAVGGRGGVVQTVEVVQVTPVSLGARGRQDGGGAVGAGEADHLVTVCQELRDEGGADVTGRSGDEYAHE